MRHWQCSPRCVMPGISSIDTVHACGHDRVITCRTLKVLHSEFGPPARTKELVNKFASIMPYPPGETPPSLQPRCRFLQKGFRGVAHGGKPSVVCLPTPQRSERSSAL